MIVKLHSTNTVLVVIIILSLSFNRYKSNRLCRTAGMRCYREENQAATEDLTAAVSSPPLPHHWRTA